VPPCGKIDALTSREATKDGRITPIVDGQRHIGDFTRWKEHDAYGKALERLPRDLKAGVSPATDG
jgi:hypothetical protein